MQHCPQLFLSRSISTSHFYLGHKYLNTMNYHHSEVQLQEFDDPPPRQQPISNRKPSRKKLILILLMISLSFYFLFLIISSSSTSKTSSSTAAYKTAAKLTLDDVLSGKLYPKTFNATWIQGNRLQYNSRKGDLMLYNINNSSSTILIHHSVFIQQFGHRPYECKFSPSSSSSSKILISHDPQKLYRHSLLAFYDIYDIHSKTFTQLGVFNNQQRRITLAIWSENEDNTVAFVLQNNIYIFNTTSQTQTQVTYDGNSLILNGVADWVYEEEMLGTNCGMYLRSDYLAFITFNDSLVDSIQFPVYGEPGNPAYQYPLFEAIPYPKSGRTNPTAVVNIYDIYKQTINPIRFPLHIPKEHYIGQVKWTTSSDLLVQVLNRHQNESWILTCSPVSAQCIIMEKLSESRGWLDVTPIHEAGEGNFVTLTSNVEAADDKAYKHVTLFNRNSIVKFLTRGPFSVDAILGVNLHTNTLYFQAGLITESGSVDPGQSHLYSTTLNSVDADFKCVTCALNCTFNTILFNPLFTHFAHSCNQFLTRVNIYSIQQDGALKKTLVWEDNVNLEEKLKSLSMPTEEYYEIPAQDSLGQNYTLRVKLWIPQHLDRNIKYPLLIDVYGGPGSQKVTEKWGIDWGTSLVSDKNIIYGSIDGRGSGRQSNELLFAIYRKLGSFEVQDQIKAVKWLTTNLEFIDPEKVGIWGWSYGGFVTAMVMATDQQNIFKCGISVAPVTNWAFYDSIYTERYMGLPTMEDNFSAYNNSDVTNYVNNFKHKQFLLVHGNADDNVHYQQSMVLARALEINDILFRQQSYPDESHGLGGVRRHLYHTLEDFLATECFS